MIWDIEFVLRIYLSFAVQNDMSHADNGLRLDTTYEGERVRNRQPSPSQPEKHSPSEKGDFEEGDPFLC